MVNIPTLAVTGGLLGVANLFAIQTVQRQILWQATDSFGNPVLNATGQPAGSAALSPQVVVEEHHETELVITRHPVQAGVQVSDHAFMAPARVRMRGGWSSSFGIPFSLIPAPNNPGYLSALYNVLLSIQSTRALVGLVTGKKTYNNMMLGALIVETDQKSEFVLNFLAEFEEIFLTQTRLTTLSSTNQANPSITSSTTNVGRQNLASGAKYSSTAGNAVVGSAFQNPTVGGGSAPGP